MEKKQPFMLLCSETCLTEQINNFEVIIENYRLERCDSHSRHTGGVAIYIRENIDYKILTNKCFLRSIWCIVLEIKNDFKKGIYVILYRSPSSSISCFLNILDDLCKQFIVPSKTCVIVGDFNIDVSKISTYSQKLNDIIINSGQVQIVDYHTRITATSRTIIDLVTTNNSNITSKAIDKISDHETLQINIPVKDKNIAETSYISWKNYTKDLLIEILVRKDWSMCYNVISTNNDRLIFLCDNIVNAVSLLVERKTCKINVKNKWFDNKLRKMKSDKIVSLTKAKMTNDEIDWNTFKKINAEYKKEIRYKSNEY